MQTLKQLNITRTQRNNLLKLARFLEASAPPPTFHMGEYARTDGGYYRISNRKNAEVKKALTECGSTACAIGHGPLVGIRIKPEIDDYWGNYAIRVFGTNESSSAHGAWMFHWGWQNFDNTPQGAAKRIFYYLEHGVPEGFKPSFGYASINPTPEVLDLYTNQRSL